jgi:5-methylcytosine-specific restriction endonuclease McrA
MYKCNRCQVEKPWSEFHKNRSEPHGYSRRCRECSKQHQHKANAVCEWCGESYYKQPSSFGRFCSMTCSAARRDRKVVDTCRICGKEFIAHAYEYGMKRFCSKRCGMLSRRGPRAAWWKGGPVKKVCKACGKSFEAKYNLRNQAQFCSIQCAGPNRNLPRKERHHAWRGGSSRDAYIGFTKEFCCSIRERDGKCMICGIVENGLSVHHIDYNKSNTTAENCIALCRSCHGKTNFNREYWQEFLMVIMVENGYASTT